MLISITFGYAGQLFFTYLLGEQQILCRFQSDLLAGAGCDTEVDPSNLETKIESQNETDFAACSTAKGKRKEI